MSHLIVARKDFRESLHLASMEIRRRLSVSLPTFRRCVPTVGSLVVSRVYESESGTDILDSKPCNLHPGTPTLIEMSGFGKIESIYSTNCQGERFGRLAEFRDEYLGRLDICCSGSDSVVPLSGWGLSDSMKCITTKRSTS